MFDKENYRLRSQELDLESIYDYLNELFNYVNVVRETKCMVVLGAEKSGQSTMLNSLVHGSDALTETKHHLLVNVLSDDQQIETKHVEREAIMFKESSNISQDVAFHISQSKSDNQTVIPKLVYHE